MATTMIYLTGEADWVKVDKPDEKYNRWGLTLYPDDESLLKFKESGLRVEVHSDPKNNRPFVRLGRSVEALIKGKVLRYDPPVIFDANNNQFEKVPRIGRGSNVTVKVAVFDTSKGKGHRLESVRVNSLVDPSEVIIDASNEESPF